MNKFRTFHYLSPLVVFFILLLTTAISEGKEAQISTYEPLTDVNLLNTVSEESVQSLQEFISVIIVLKNQPLGKVKDEVLSKHDRVISGYETEVNRRLEKTKEQILTLPKVAQSTSNVQTITKSEKKVKGLTTIMVNEAYEKEIQIMAEENEKREKEVREKGASVSIQSALSVLSESEKEELRELKKKIDAESDLAKKEIYEKLSSKVRDDQNEVMEVIDNCNGIITGKSVLISSVFARIPSSCLYDLKESDKVLAVYEDIAMPVDLDISVHSMLTSTWHNAGYTGGGGIWDAAVVDTGVDFTHPALSSHSSFSNVFHNEAQTDSCYNDNTSSTDDLNGHGTHVAGIIASTNPTYKGVAYGLDVLINAKVCYSRNTGGSCGIFSALCSSGDGRQGIDWAIITAGADVISRSIEMCPSGSTDCEMARFLDAVVDDLGISVVNAAGNSGPNTGTVGGIAYNAFSVAAIDDKATTSRSGDSIAGYSSRGPTSDWRVKPDIAAPGGDFSGSGTAIISTNNNWETSSDFIEFQGTSMAAPHIAGAILLILDYKGIRWDPKAIRALLFNTADTSGSFSSKNDFGWGYIDLDHAYFHRDDVNLSKIKEGKSKYYKGYAYSGDKATLVWNRHVTYNDANNPVTYYTLNDLDLFFYNESNNVLLDSSESGFDNVEQVEANAYSPSVVVRVLAYTTDFVHGSDYEDFALASEEGFVSSNSPLITITQNVPSQATSKVNFTITATVSNAGDLKAHNVNATLNLPSGLSLLSGNKSYSLGSIAAGSTATATWVVNATGGVGTYVNIYAYANSTSYGELFSNITTTSSVTVKERLPLSCGGSTVRNCNFANSVLAVTNMSLFGQPKQGQNVTLQLNWTGWHFGDANHFAFFIDNSSTLIGSCTSYYDDVQYMAYSMNYSLLIPYNISPGKHALNVTANDFLGYCEPNENGVDTEASFELNVIDGIKPTISITTPQNDSWIATSAIWFNLTTNENATCSYEVQTCDGGGGGGCGGSIEKNMSVTGGVSHSQLVTGLSDTTSNGYHKLTASCVDSESNSNTTSVTFYVDTIIPMPHSYNPSNGSYIDGSGNLTLYVNYTETNLDFIELFWNETWPFACGSIGTCPPVQLNYCGSGAKKVCAVNVGLSNYSDGSFIVYYFGVFEKSGRSTYLGNIPYKLFIDKFAPQISFGAQTEQNNANVSRNWIYVNVSVNESHEANTTFNLYNSTGLVNRSSFSTTKRSLNFTDLRDGTYYYNVTVLDFAMRKNSTETRTIRLDTNPPIVVLYSPSNSSYNVKNLTINVSINELAQQIKRSLDGEGNVTLCENCNSYNGANLTALSEGSHSLTIHATDYVNNSASLAVTFIVDTIMPSINITSLSNNRNLTTSFIWFNLTTDESASCTYDLCKVEEKEGEAWRVGTPSKKLEFSEGLDSGAVSPRQEVVRNITTFISEDEMPNLLATGTFSNTQGDYDYRQYMYFDTNAAQASPGASMSVVYAEDPDTNKAADYFYVKNGDSVVRYSLEFTETAKTDITDSAGTVSSTGTFLWDFEGKTIKMLGKDWTILKARTDSANHSEVDMTLMTGTVKDTLNEGDSKTYTINDKDYEVTLDFVGSTTTKLTINGEVTDSLSEGGFQTLKDGTHVGIKDIIPQEFGGGVGKIEFYLGADKIRLRDTQTIGTQGGEQTIEVGSESITGTRVVITGWNSSSNSYTLSSMQVNMTADEDVYVAAGKKLSSQLRRPQALLNSWDIEYGGLEPVSTEKIKLSPSGSTQYYLEFQDGAGKNVKLPVAYTAGTTQLKLGDNDDDLVLNENQSITRNDYFVITDSTQKQGERKTYGLRYISALASTETSPKLEFQDLGTGGKVEVDYKAATGAADVGMEDATLKLGGGTYKIWNASADTSTNFNLKIDLDGDGTLETTNTGGVMDQRNFINVTTKGGAQIVLAFHPLNATNSTTLNTVDELAAGVGAASIIVSVQTVDADDYDNIVPSSVEFNISAASAKVDIAEHTVGVNLRYVTPSDDTNLRQLYTSLGAFVNWKTVSNDPDILEIDYPTVQRLPLLYVTSYGANVSDLFESAECIASQQKMTVTGGTSHSHLLQNVDDTTTNLHYLLTVNCTDSASNTNTTSLNFYVDAKAPTLSNIRHSFVTNDSAIISWNLSESSNGTVEYGLSNNYGFSVADTLYRTEHKIALTGLQQDTTYHYRVKSFDYFGNENVSQNFAFRTAVTEHIKQTITANETTTISSSVTNTTLDIVVKANVSNVAINITSGKESPTNKSLNVSGLKYLNIDVDNVLAQMLTSVLIKIHYTDEEISEQNLAESSLGIYLYNSTLDEWVKLNSLLDWVFGSGVDEANNYVWANISHFSSYGAGGLTADGFYCSSNSQCASNYCSNNICSTPSSGGDNLPSGSSSGGGGGGGGGGASQASETVLLQAELDAGDSGTFSFKKFNELAVYEINAKVLTSNTNPSITIKGASLASSVPLPIAETGKVYKYLSIIKSSLENVSETTIKFRVNDTWFSKNSIDPAKVKLNRLEGGNWNALPTALLSDDDQFTSYQATTPGFSTFAITGEFGKSSPPQIQEQEASSVSEQTTEAPKETTEEVEEEVTKEESKPNLIGRMFSLITGRAVTGTGNEQPRFKPATLLLIGAIILIIILRIRKVKFGPLYLSWYKQKLRLNKKE